ncbi:unnamed protein product [Amoebophrya sp. A120]|nr:unnamed protein product [Amoebophrya sp. A120]|eukprot:GSA120T00014616001.1
MFPSFRCSVGFFLLSLVVACEFIIATKIDFKLLTGRTVLTIDTKEEFEDPHVAAVATHDYRPLSSYLREKLPGEFFDNVNSNRKPEVFYKLQKLDLETTTVSDLVKAVECDKLACFTHRASRGGRAGDHHDAHDGSRKAVVEEQKQEDFHEDLCSATVNITFVEKSIADFLFAVAKNPVKELFAGGKVNFSQPSIRFDLRKLLVDVLPVVDKVKVPADAEQEGEGRRGLQQKQERPQELQLPLFLQNLVTYRRSGLEKEESERIRAASLQGDDHEENAEELRRNDNAQKLAEQFDKDFLLPLQESAFGTTPAAPLLRQEPAKSSFPSTQANGSAGQHRAIAVLGEQQEKKETTVRPHYFLGEFYPRRREDVGLKFKQILSSLMQNHNSSGRKGSRKTSRKNPSPATTRTSALVPGDPASSSLLSSSTSIAAGINVQPQRRRRSTPSKQHSHSDHESSEADSTDSTVGDSSLPSSPASTASRNKGRRSKSQAASRNGLLHGARPPATVTARKMLKTLAEKEDAHIGNLPLHILDLLESALSGGSSSTSTTTSHAGRPPRREETSKPLNFGCILYDSYPGGPLSFVYFLFTETKELQQQICFELGADAWKDPEFARLDDGRILQIRFDLDKVDTIYGRVAQQVPHRAISRVGGNHTPYDLYGVSFTMRVPRVEAEGMEYFPPPKLPKTVLTTAAADGDGIANHDGPRGEEVEQAGAAPAPQPPAAQQEHHQRTKTMRTVLEKFDALPRPFDLDAVLAGQLPEPPRYGIVEFKMQKNNTLMKVETAHGNTLHTAPEGGFFVV